MHQVGIRAAILNQAWLQGKVEKGDVSKEFLVVEATELFAICASSFFCWHTSQLLDP